MLVNAVQEKWSEKKLAGALFMDVKGAFDHVSRSQLLKCMIDLGIDGDLVAWTKSFLTDRKIQLVIDGYDNKEREIRTGIPQRSPVSPILFLIYVIGVFDAVTKDNVGVEGRTSWKVMEVHKRSWKVMEPDGRFGLSDQV